MVKIRLTRIGRKNSPAYRFVVTPARSKRDGEMIEYLGEYNKVIKPFTVKINKERMQYWLSQGAQPTDTARTVLIKEGLLKADKTKKVYTKTPGKKATARQPKAAEAAS